MSFHQFHDGGMSGIQEPEVFYLGPNIPLADEDDEEEESSQHVATVNDSEEDANRFVILAWLTIMMVDDEIDTLDDPQNTENKKEFCVENLKKIIYLFIIYLQNNSK